MGNWPPSDLKVAEIQADIRALKPSERTAAYARLASHYGVAASTVRRAIPVGDRKTRPDAGESKAAIPASAEVRIRCEQTMTARSLIEDMESRGEIEPGSISVEQVKRIRRGDAAVARHAPEPEVVDEVIGFIDYCEENILLRGRPWSLDGHEYLREIYQALELCPAVVCRKGVQVCISTALILEAIYRCDIQKYKAIHYLPTDKFAERFSDDRVGPIIGDSAHLEAITKIRGERARDNKGLRHIGHGSYYILGLFTEVNTSSVDGDFVALDEVDLCNQENRKYAADRVQHSDLQHIREASKPTIPGFGIDEAFSRSDQRYWHLACEACGEKTCLELSLGDERPVALPKAFLPVPDGAAWAKPGQKYYRACLHCASPLDMSRGEWMPENPDSHIIGYHVSALYREQHSPLYADAADQIMDEIHEANTRSECKRVYTSIYGFPYEDSDLSIDDEKLRAATGTHAVVEDERPKTYMGVDQGNTLHVLILRPAASGQRLIITGLYITEDWGDLSKIHARHNVAAMVGDALPEGTMMRDVARKLGGHVCYYSLGKSIEIGEKDDIHGTVKTVTTDRTESIDEVVAGIGEQSILLPDEAACDGRGAKMVETLSRHLKNLKRELKESASGTVRWSYLANVENHFGMALNYANMAYMIDVASGVKEFEVFSETASPAAYDGMGFYDVMDFAGY